MGHKRVLEENPDKAETQTNDKRGKTNKTNSVAFSPQAKYTD
jgi:hypothetical protein